MNFPAVKGWVPFKGSENQNKEKNPLTGKMKRNNAENDLEKVEIPVDWKEEKFTLEDNPHRRLFAATECKVLYPRALDPYLKQIFPIVKKSLGEFQIKAEISVLDGEMIVKTTPKTYDPAIILKAHSLIKLLARYVPIEEAVTILEDDMCEDIIPIGHSKMDTFVRRRARFDCDEMKELIKEVLGVKIFVSGKSIAALGSSSSLNKLVKIVNDCFQHNMHPIYHLKRFQLMNKLAEMPEMKDQDWSGLLPPLPKKKNVKRKAPKIVREKKEYTPFVASQCEQKVDQEIADGIFNLKYEKVPGKKYYKSKDKIENMAKKRKLEE